MHVLACKLIFYTLIRGDPHKINKLSNKFSDRWHLKFFFNFEGRMLKWSKACLLRRGGTAMNIFQYWRLCVLCCAAAGSFYKSEQMHMRPNTQTAGIRNICVHDIAVWIKLSFSTTKGHYWLKLFSEMALGNWSLTIRNEFVLFISTRSRQMNCPQFFSITSVLQLNIEMWQQWCNAIKSVHITQSLNAESTLAKRGTVKRPH